MTFASVATEWPATQQAWSCAGRPMRFDKSLGANHGARSPRCVAVQRNAGVELATASMVPGRFRVFHQLAVLARQFLVLVRY